MIEPAWQTKTSTGLRGEDSLSKVKRQNAPFDCRLNSKFKNINQIKSREAGDTQTDQPTRDWHVDCRLQKAIIADGRVKRLVYLLLHMRQRVFTRETTDLLLFAYKWEHSTSSNYQNLY